MTAPASSLPNPIAQAHKHELAVVIVLCIVAGLRILIFSAAFPFFNNIDEQSHFDVIHKYSVGHIPHRLDFYSREPARLFALYGSPEYLRGPRDFMGNKIPEPVWRAISKGVKLPVTEAIANWTAETNPETTQPPVYYLIAGGWYRLGQLMHVRDGMLLYWLRLMNVPVYAGLVWLAYVFVKRLYPDALFPRLGVPLLLACFPQDVFYSLNNDILLALLSGASLYCLLLIGTGRSTGYGPYVWAGLLTSAAFLTKFSGIGIVVALFVVFLMKACTVRRSKAIRRGWERPALLLLSAGLPAGFWLLRNHLVLWDITGSAEKISRLGWTVKSLSDIWQHPIFSSGGIVTFWDGLMRSLWRGELVWHGVGMSATGTDLFYSISSFVFLAAAVVGLAVRRKTMSPEERFNDVMNLCVLGVSIAFMAVVSVSYDYGDCWYPSNESPYLISGRLITGALIPFLMLYLKGLSYTLTSVRIGRAYPAAVLGIAVMMLGSEAWFSYPVFQSAYNLFHML